MEFPIYGNHQKQGQSQPGIMPVALLVSLAVHLGLVGWYLLASSTAPRALPPAPDFEITLHSKPQPRLSPSTDQADSVATATIEDTSTQPDIDTRSAEVAIAALPAEPHAEANMTSPAPLNLNLPMPEPKRPEPSVPEHRTRGTVVNPAVKKQLAAARELPDGLVEYPALIHPDDSEAIFQGGQWIAWVKLGNHCFRWVQADPLDPFSEDQWFRTTSSGTDRCARASQ